MSDSATPWTAARQASLIITNSRSLLKLMSIEFVMLSNHLILCRPLLLQLSIFPSIRVFFNESALHNKWPKYWSFSFNLTSSNEHSGLILGWTGWISLQSKGLLRVFSILGRSKNYSCSSFGKTESRHTHFITGTVAKFTKVITQFLILEPVNMFWRALGQSVHF